MKLEVAIDLIHKAFKKSDTLREEVWCDLGAGKGLFTDALASLVSKGSTIYAIDKGVIGGNENKDQIVIKKLQLDFELDELPDIAFDGILMANSFHFVADKISFIKKLKKYLKTSGRLIIIEYDMDNANHWVPFPISYEPLKNLFTKAGFATVEKLSETTSIYQKANIYAALISG
jgi:ubiquinone/menaquinone biosynthesis C-methylase UbiE